MVKQRSSWRYENLDEFSTAVLRAAEISDPLEREYQLKQLSIHNGVSLKELYRPPRTHIKGRKIIHQFGDWYVVSSGILHAPMNYLIDRDRLNELSWPEHIAGKTWSNQSDFMQAWNFALQHWNVSFSPPDQELWERRKQRRASVAPVVPLRE